MKEFKVRITKGETCYLVKVTHVPTERKFDTFSEALKYYEEIKKDEETLEARLDIVTPFTIYIKGERENG